MKLNLGCRDIVYSIVINNIDFIVNEKSSGKPKLHWLSDFEFLITINSTKYKGYFVLLDDEDAIIININHYHYRFTLMSEGAFAKSDAASNDIRSSLPGKVISVSVKEGDLVKAQDVAVVLEAMKMEHALKIVRDGKVAEVNVQAGDQIEADTVLIKVL